MTPSLTDDQRHAIEEHGGQPVYLIDASTNSGYVLMKAEDYAKVKALFEDEGSQPGDLYPLVEQSFLKAGWDDPAMDAYDDYDAHRPQP